MRFSASMRWMGWACVLAAAFLSSTIGRAQSAPKTIPALMVSDIHFDPFHDPARAKLLARDPVSEWAKVLASPRSTQASADFEKLQDTCHAKGVDTPYTLLRSSLQAMQQQPAPRFITLTGDLLAHEFDCRYRATIGGSAANYEGFAVKTLQFVVAQLRDAFPGVPIYISLGNNDSGCGDYQMDPDSQFLRQTAAVFADALPARDRTAAEREFAVGGYYAVTMTEPMHDTRLIVLNDLFLSPDYRGCSGATNAAAGRAEIAWLARQLAQAHRAGQKVWVMGHIPPGVNAYATLRKTLGACDEAKVELFLEPSGLDDLLTRYGAEIRLVIFGHTHMDEMRLIQPSTAGGQAVAVKLVPSITPVHGNHPAFLEARIDPKSAVLEDYDVIAASNTTGIGTQWSREYDYAASYHEPNYTAASLHQLFAEFQHDPGATTRASQDYLRDYYAGGLALALKPFWPQYVCSIEHMTAKGYMACACAGKQGASGR